MPTKKTPSKTTTKVTAKPTTPSKPKPKNLVQGSFFNVLLKQIVYREVRIGNAPVKIEQDETHFIDMAFSLPHTRKSPTVLVPATIKDAEEHATVWIDENTTDLVKYEIDSISRGSCDCAILV